MTTKSVTLKYTEAHQTVGAVGLLLQMAGNLPDFMRPPLQSLVEFLGDVDVDMTRADESLTLDLDDKQIELFEVATTVLVKVLEDRTIEGCPFTCEQVQSTVDLYSGLRGE